MNSCCYCLTDSGFPDPEAPPWLYGAQHSALLWKDSRLMLKHQSHCQIDFEGNHLELQNQKKYNINLPLIYKFVISKLMTK